jgi:hypothetical protein
MIVLSLSSQCSPDVDLDASGLVARSPLEIQGIAPGFTPHHLLEVEAMTAIA